MDYSQEAAKQAASPNVQPANMIVRVINLDVTQPIDFETPV